MNAREQRRRLATDELIDRVALEEMAAAHGDFSLEPVAVVVAAYREVDNIDGVLAGMPEKIGELGVSVVVVVDGEDDGTGATGSPPSGGGGHGLAGMRERARALGGNVQAGPRPGGGFRVRAWLPTSNGSA